jgi:hypothetical protein
VLNVDKKKTEEEDEGGLYEYLAETCGCVYEESSCAGLGLVFLWLMNFIFRTK